MNKITLGQTSVRRIFYPQNASAPVQFAAQELQSYLKKSLNVAIDAREGVSAKGAFFLSTVQANPEAIAKAGPFKKGKYDQSVAFGRDGCIFMIGENPVSVLYAVYDFLQACLNIRFFAPGRQHEYIPKHSALHLDDRFVFQTGSRFAIRDWVNRTNNPEVIAFAAKNRINTILGCGPWNPSLGSDHCNAKNADLVRSYGLKLRGPGHSWRRFVPDESLFNEHPEYFPMINGKRTVNNRTACFSNPYARKIFCQNLRNYLQKNPYWDIFAFWAEDINDSYYCGCLECQKMGVSDWYITLVNEAAKVVEQELPRAVFELIAYHGTRIPPKQVKKLYRNGKNMLVNFCLGQTRDLYNPLQKKTYGSAKVFSTYQSWRKYLSEVVFKGRIMLMEYYNLCEWPNYGPRGRALLWPMEVIREDIRFYQKEGINGLGAFTGFDCFCWPSPFNMWCWLQLWNNPETKVEALKDDFYPKYFGKVGHAVREYIDRLEEAMHARTSPENIMRVKELSKMLDSIRPQQKDRQLIHRLKLVRIHHKYCVLLKEMFQAFINKDLPGWQTLKKLYMTFFEGHRADMERHMAPFPPLWAHFYWSHFEQGLKITKDEMLH